MLILAAGATLLLARLLIGIARIAWITRQATLRDGIYYTDSPYRNGDSIPQ